MGCVADMRSELLELVVHLKQERLFVTLERQQLQELNEKVLKTAEKLYHASWINKQQRLNVESLVLSKPECSPAVCCRRAASLEKTNFIEGYKQLGFNESAYGEFFFDLRENPKLLAMCLACGDKLGLENMHQMVHVVLSSVYGHCVLQEDENYVLQMLKQLLEMQLATNENPRRLLRHGSCAFSRMYKMFIEGLFPAKLFLTAALYDPIIQILVEDELFLDIDPSKAVVRFPRHERLKRFGKEGTPEFHTNLQKYRNWTISKLASLTNRFIAGIKSNMYCFPSSLSWLVKQLFSVVMKNKVVEVREIGAMCADLVFAFFICPAIVNPEPYGITCDASISHIARFNLMQVAQILQVLAMAKWEEFDPKLMDLYGKFEKDCMSSILDAMLEGSVEDRPLQGSIHQQQQGLARTAVLIAPSELQAMMAFLKRVSTELGEDQMERKLLESLLSNLPQATSGGTSPNLSAQPPSNPTPPTTPHVRRHILNKVGKGLARSNLLSPSAENSEDHRGEGDEAGGQTAELEEVMVINLNNATQFLCPGLLPEEKVLSMEQQNRQSRVRMNLDGLPNEEGSITSGGEGSEKRTRFSLSHDQDSVGTSDNLEAISEGASNHSVASSMEMEDQNENDNLSDMVSANVSGRGSPNVSGRDTPLSQLEGEERETRRLDYAVPPPKQNQSDINDKFGKFEIKPLMEGDETVSMVSDTWSTDVLASDSETVEQSEPSLPGSHLDDITIPGVPNLLGPPTGDVPDSVSEAWSTDVLQSDTERLLDIDTDDSVSVTRSDDTGRSETDAEPFNLSALPEQSEENITPRAAGSRSPITICI